MGLVRPREKECSTTAHPLCPLSQLCYFSLQGCEVGTSGEQNGHTHAPQLGTMNVTGPCEMSLSLGLILFFPPIHPSPQSPPPCPVHTHAVCSSCALSIYFPNTSNFLAVSVVLDFLFCFNFFHRFFYLSIAESQCYISFRCTTQ